MIKLCLRRATLFICLLFVLPVNADQSFSSMYIFGDSLSDTGNAASIVGDFPPPYDNKRASNGPVAVEVLADNLGLSADASLYLIGQNAGTNYAVASASAGGSEIIDLTGQVNVFLAVHGFSAPDDALYIVFIGGNDVRGVREIQDKQSVDIVLQNAVDNIKQNIHNLIMSGAKSIVLVNSIDVGNIPETLLLAQLLNDPKLIKRTTKRTRHFNKLLKKSLHGLEKDYDIEIAKFDAFKFIRKVIAKSESFGFNFVNEPCFYRSTLTFNPDCNFGLNANEFLFFDEIHPTTKGHMLIGNAMLEAVEELDDQN